MWLPHAKRDRSGGCSIPRHFRLAAHVSTVGNRSDTCETSRGTPLFGRMRLAIDRPRDPVAAISYENLPLKVGPILPSANRVGGCGYCLSLNFASATSETPVTGDARTTTRNPPHCGCIIHRHRGLARSQAGGCMLFLCCKFSHPLSSGRAVDMPRSDATQHLSSRDRRGSVRPGTTPVRIQAEAVLGFCARMRHYVDPLSPRPLHP